MERKTHVIDATDKVLGRLSAQIAALLRGKHKTSFVPYRDMGDFVTVKNVHKLKITGKKMEQKKYFSHSGYLGSGKQKPLKNLFKEKPEDVLIKSVLGMLPKNKLRKEIIKKLKFIQ